MVLVVDDDAEVRSVAAGILADVGGYRIIEAGDGEEALAILRTTPDIACLLTDVTMPRRDGISLARAARALDPDLRILLMTGAGMVPGLQDHRLVRKPYRAAELIAAVSSAAMRQAAE